MGRRECRRRIFVASIPPMLTAVPSGPGRCFVTVLIEIRLANFLSFFLMPEKRPGSPICWASWYSRRKPIVSPDRFQHAAPTRQDAPGKPVLGVLGVQVSDVGRLLRIGRVEPPGALGGPVGF